MLRWLVSECSTMALADQIILDFKKVTLIYTVFCKPTQIFSMIKNAHLFFFFQHRRQWFIGPVGGDTEVRANTENFRLFAEVAKTKPSIY